MKREHSPVNHTSPQLANENSALNASATKHSQTAREASTSPDKTSSNSEQNQVQPAELFISLDNISESSHNVTVSPKKSQAKCNTPGIYARQPDENNGKTILSPFGNFHNFASQSLPPNHVSQGRNIQFAAQAISIKKLEPNLIRLFISDNGEKTEFTVNTKAVLGKGSFGKVFKVTIFCTKTDIYPGKPKVLGLQLFIDDIIGSCNFTTFSIMKSTRVPQWTES